MYIGICDDNPQSRNTLKTLLQQNNFYAIPMQIYEFSTVNALLEQFMKLDLLFLDIEVGQDNSLNAFAKSNLLQTMPIIVLVSSYPCYVTQSYQLPIFQFLVKPVPPDLFSNVFMHCQKHYLQSHKNCTVQTEQGINRILPLQQIICIKSEKQKIFYYATDLTWYHSTEKSLANVLNRLQDYNFSQIHKSYLINLAFILQIEDSNVILQLDGKTKKLPIGKKYWEITKHNYLQYLATKGAI